MDSGRHVQKSGQGAGLHELPGEFMSSVCLALASRYMQRRSDSSRLGSPSGGDGDDRKGCLAFESSKAAKLP